MAYCDRNILTAFVSKNELGRNFGKRGIKSYPNITSQKNQEAENKLKKIDGCKISKMALLNDLGGHQSAMGGTLTSINLKNVVVVDVDGFKRGKREFNRICTIKSNSLDSFQSRFCNRGKLKSNLKKNQIEDIRHLGSALELGEKEFITADRKDFKVLNPYLKHIEII